MDRLSAAFGEHGITSLPDSETTRKPSMSFRTLVPAIASEDASAQIAPTVANAMPKRKLPKIAKHPAPNPTPMSMRRAIVRTKNLPVVAGSIVKPSGLRTEMSTLVMTAS